MQRPLSKLFASPLNSKSFPFGADPFSEWDWFMGTQTGSHKTCLPCKNVGKKIPDVPSKDRIIRHFDSTDILQITPQKQSSRKIHEIKARRKTQYTNKFGFAL